MGHFEEEGSGEHCVHLNAQTGIIWCFKCQDEIHRPCRGGMLESVYCLRVERHVCCACLE